MKRAIDVLLAFAADVAAILIPLLILLALTFL